MKDGEGGSSVCDVIYKWPVTVTGIWTNVLAGVNTSKLLASSKKEARPGMKETIFRIFVSFPFK